MGLLNVIDLDEGWNLDSEFYERKKFFEPYNSIEIKNKKKQTLLNMMISNFF